MQRLRSVIIPAEIETREFDAKLLLACIAAKRGFTAYVGSRFAVNMAAERLPASIRLEKGVTGRSRKMFRNARDLGHMLMSWDEEGLVYYSRDLYYERRLSQKTMNLVRGLLAWGEDNAETWREWPHYSGTPIAVTGNPRVDLLRPEFRDYYAEPARRLRDRFGDFILINSNFGTVNFFYPHLSRFAGDRESMPDEGLDTLAGHRRELFRHFLQMVPAVARAFPDQTIVLRPHPAENSDTWRTACADLPNVRVVLEGAVPPWLLAAKMVIHNGCTTGVEAALLGRPVVAYQPITSERWDIRLPNALSHPVFSTEALIESIGMILSGRSLGSVDSDERQRILEKHITGLTERFASERIMDAVERLRDEGVPHPISLRRRIRSIRRIRRRRSKKQERLGWKDSPLSLEFKSHSFPPLPVAEVRARVDRLRAVNPIVPALTIEELTTNVFRIERADRPTRVGKWRWYWTGLLP